MKRNRSTRMVCMAVVFSACGAFWFWSGGVTAATALEPGEVSLVAEMHAGYRAIGAMHPDRKVRNPDYLARDLLPPNFWTVGPLLPDYNRARMFIKTYRISRYFTANALTRHIDGILVQMGTNGLSQVVIIGAGFDSRAYRFAKQMPDVKFFELDQPATMQAKMARVEAVIGSLPSHVTFIPIDNRSKTVFQALMRAGYRDNVKTLFIWEGASSYTDREVAEETLRWISRHAVPGSEVVFDYIVDEVVRGDYSKHRSARFSALRLTVNGEPWRFGIPEGQAESFATEHGLKFISDLGAEELAQQYLVRSTGEVDGKPTSWWRVTHAKVDR